jgi:integrase
VAKHLLSARAVQLAGPGDHSDGEGLLLHIDERRSHWVLRYTSPGGRRRELGLGRADRTSLAASGRSLTDAREAADAARRLLRAGRDPIDEKHAARAAARKGEAERKAEIRRERTTLARVARGYHERVIEPRRTTTHAREWIGSLERHVPKGLWHKPIDRIEAPELLDAVARVTMKYPETGRRVRQRLELIFADAEFHKLCIGNPGRAIREKVREQCGGRRTQSYRALGYREVPAFMKRLRAVPGISARALEFGLLTVARTGEIRGARWSEIDFASKTWTVPAERMKARQPHLVPLSDCALEILEGQRGISTKYVFPSVRGEGAPLSTMAMLECLRRLNVAAQTTVHGLCRASFATWAYEAAGAREEIVEACLAHKEADRVKAAYDRSQHHAARRHLLQAWADFVNGKAPASNVIEGDFRTLREHAGLPATQPAPARG